VPALRILLREANEDLAKLEVAVNRSDYEPTVDNLLRPYTLVGDRLWRAYQFANHLQSVRDSQALRDAIEAIRPDAIVHSNALSQSKPLYNAFKQLNSSTHSAALSDPQRRLVDLTISDFELSGVGLEGAQREEFNSIKQELSNRSTVYENNVLDSTKSWKKWIQSAEQLQGLPEAPIALARQAADQERERRRKERADAPLNSSILQDGLGPYLLTLDAPSVGPVLTYAEDAGLRKEIYIASLEKASELLTPDNTGVLRSILQLRQREAELLGFDNYAELSMQRKMATLPEAKKLLEELRAISYPKAQGDLANLQQFAESHNYSGTLKHWDASYWSHKQVKELFSIDAEMLRPYFPLDRCLAGLFNLTEKMLGAHVAPATGPTWHEDVKLFKIYRAGSDESPAGHFYLDLFSRPQEKRAGAWMSGIVGYDSIRGVKPISAIVASMRPPHGSAPALLSFDELHTLFHEFGHALQHMLTTQPEPSLAGVSSEWDAVEFPSQFMEYWLDETDWVVDSIASHHETGEPLPREMLESLKASMKYQAGMGMLGQLHMSILDLDLHTRPLGPNESPHDREQAVSTSHMTRLMPMLPQDRFLNHFSHIFAGGYAAGYYSYKWAEVLSADAFALFQEQNATQCGAEGFTRLREVGQSFAKTVLGEGGGRTAADIFESFRHRSPSTSPLLKYTFGGSV